MTYINTSNWQYFFYEDDYYIYRGVIDMMDYPYYDENDTINIKKSKYTNQIYGGKGNDTIYGSKKHMNFLYGDKAYEVFGTAAENKDYFKVSGSDSIYGGNYTDYINAGPGNDYINGGKGINVILCKTGDGIDTISYGKGKDYLYFIDSRYNDLSFSRQNNDLIISYGTNDKIIITNHFKKTSLKGIADMYINKNEVQAAYQAFYDITEKQGTSALKRTLTQARSIASCIYAQGTIETVMTYAYKYKGSNYNEIITGSSGNDTIKCGKGNDEITGGYGNDKITGGKGTTVINYSKGDGNDIIYLTKGEKLSLNISGIDDISKLSFTLANKNKDIRIFTSDSEYITIKNLAKKNVTNTYTKKNPTDTSCVELVLNDNTYNLRPTSLDNGILYKVSPTKKYSGTWLSEDIDASEVTLYKKVHRELQEKSITDKGLVLNGKSGNDKITGTKYSDTLKAGTGIDTITGGTGNDKLYGGSNSSSKTTYIFNTNDGNDIIYSGKGSDIIILNNISLADISHSQGIKKNKKDLIIKYSDNDSITIKNYYKINNKGKIVGFNKKNSVKQICLNEGTYSVSDIATNLLDEHMNIYNNNSLNSIISSVASWSNKDTSSVALIPENIKNEQINNILAMVN